MCVAMDCPVHQALDYACLVMSTQAATELMLQEATLLTYIPLTFFVNACFFILLWAGMSACKTFLDQAWETAFKKWLGEGPILVL
jgi:hypothetical protein